jgi:hypothetical protein
MKKSILVLSLLFVVTQSNCGVFDTALTYLKDNGMDLLKKGGQYLWDNSDKIFATVKDNAGPLFDQAKNLLFGEAKKEADKEEQVIIAKAKDIIATTPGLTQAEQQVILKEAQAIATKNRAELENVARQSIEQKKAALRSSIYEKFGKGTPTKS